MRHAAIVLVVCITAAMGLGADDCVAGTSSPDDAEPVSEVAMSGSGGPVLIVIQGRLADGAEAFYEQYLAGTRPLMAEYGATVEAVGRGLDSEYTTDSWPINGILSFPDRAAAEGFLADPRYLEIKKRFRDRAYQELHLSLVATRPPRVRTSKQVAEEAFEDFRRGLATGAWEPFLARLSDDFTFHFPLGRFQGLNRGKDRAAEFFAFVSQAYPQGLEVVEVHGVTAEGNRVVFEFEDDGLLFGKPYHNLVAISLDVCGEKICGYREYFGIVGPPPSAEESG
jgi:uncharacterized protein (DUF1330 family)/ketosteroid isomerase-like protein